jgi:HD-GYP domain-containing protein (c-di-GMP phosphodiesterase class II)
MVLNILGFLWIAAGGVVMVMTSIEYHKLLKYYRQELYVSLRPGYTINLVLLYVFIAGFVLCGVDSILRDIGIIYVFGAFASLLGSVFIFFSVRNQAHAAVMFREKTLEAIRAFVTTIDLKEFHTEGHSRQVRDIVVLFYEHLVDYQYILNREKLLDAAILHDIGKINISADILSKRDVLSPDEWEIIKSHPRRGKEMLDETCFREIGDWVMYHHERVDGNGYYGLVSENIPLESKILAIADTYSALRSDRSYRKRVSHDDAIEIIILEMGRHFDRKLVECFLKIDRAALEQL